METLEYIPITIDLKELLKWLNLTEKSKYIGNIKELIELANSLLDPKAIYKVSYINERNGDWVNIDGIKFSSRILRINLDGIGRVFPYIITIGKGLENKAASFESFRKYILECIGDKALGSAKKYLEDYLKKKHNIDQISQMSPGSLEDWPVMQQRQLFSLFGDAENLIKVRLNDDMFMIPKKSISGIYFPAEIKFYCCQLCPRKRCKMRKAPYDNYLAERYNLI